MERALSGIRVIQLANFVAAPSATRYLADRGADVIIIEGVKGEPLRYSAVQEGRPQDQLENTTWEYLNGGKRCIALNLKDPKGKEAFMRLLDTADVLLTNWRQQALERAGLDYDTLKERYPRLVYAMCTGYGLDGPDKDLPGYDMTAFLARGGYTHTLRRPGGPAIPMLAGLGDNNVGIALAAAVVTALYGVQRTGKGDLVSVSLYGTAIFNMSIMLMAAQYDGDARRYPIDASDYPNPLNGSYTTKDDRIIQCAMPDYNPRFDHFCRVIGRADLADSGKYLPQMQMVENGYLKELVSELNATFAAKTCAEWQEILREGDIPFSLCYNWEEIVNDPQAEASGCFYKLDCESGNTLKITHTPGTFASEVEEKVPRGPHIGENGPEILRELGYSDAEIEELQKSGAMFVQTPEMAAEHRYEVI